MKTPEPCLCGAWDCPRCYPLQHLRNRLYQECLDKLDLTEDEVEDPDTWIPLDQCIEELRLAEEQYEIDKAEARWDALQDR